MKPTLKLYEIADIYLSALDGLADIEDLPLEAIADTLEGLQCEFEDKALNVGRYIRNLEAEASAIEEAKKRMDVRAKAAARQAGRLKDYLKRELERTGLKIKAPDLTLRLQNNPASVVVDDEARIPEAFKHSEVVTKVLKLEIGKALKAGEAVAGAHLERSKRLVIA
jgi:hypothetical protein